MSEYKYDNRYGFLISNIIPFNIFSLLLSPIFIVVKNERALKKINYCLMIFAYIPIALTATAVFLVGNVIMFPFAYVVGVLKKIQLIVDGTSGCSSLGDLLLFLLFGWLILALSVFNDTTLFFCHLWSTKTESMYQGFKAEQFTLDEFYVMEQLMRKIEKAHRKNSDEQVVNVKEVL